MDAIVLIAVVSFLGSLLTFFSGFGLGTILTPVFIMFFPVEIAILLTGIVHFLNNIFKLLLTYQHIHWKIVLWFGLPAVVFAFVGSLTLYLVSGDIIMAQYQVFNSMKTITAIKLVISFLIILFVVLEIHPRFKKVAFGQNYLWVGGLLSGFFGGLSGFQGALRSMFLIKCNLSKEVFIATGVIIACAIDITRLTTYMGSFSGFSLAENAKVLMFAVLSAFSGAMIGNYLLQKVTIDAINIIVALLLIVIAVLLGLGMI